MNDCSFAHLFTMRLADWLWSLAILPWAMSFPKGIPPTTTNVFSDLYPWIDISSYESGIIRVHPTQLYEAMICFLLFFIMLKYRKSSTIKDLLFLFYIIRFLYFLIYFKQIIQKVN